MHGGIRKLKSRQGWGSCELNATFRLLIKCTDIDLWHVHVVNELVVPTGGLEFLLIEAGR
jgi:hypothetical protein